MLSMALQEKKTFRTVVKEELVLRIGRKIRLALTVENSYRHKLS